MTDSLRVLQVIPALNEGGAERTVIDVSEALVAAGHQSIVVSSGGRLIERLLSIGATSIELPVHSKNPITIYENVGRLARLIRKQNISLVHARSRAPAWSALLAARRTKRPFITTHHGTFKDAGIPKSIYNSVMARGDIVIANSDFIAQRISDKYPSAVDRTVTIPRGVDLEEFDPDAVGDERRSAFRSLPNVSDKTRLVLLPGRLTPWKGQHVFIAAAELLIRRPDFENVVFVIVGDAPDNSAYVSTLKEKVSEASLADRVKFTGHCTDMPAAYACADLVVSASTEPEAFGRIAVEAQAMKRPVIASAHGGSLETILEGETGWLCKPGDATELAHAIARAINLGPKERSDIGAKARSHVRRHFSKETMCALTLDAYQSLTSRRGQSD